MRYLRSTIRSRHVRNTAQMIQNVNFNRDRSKNLMLLPAIRQDPLLDHTFDDQLRLRRGQRQNASPRDDMNEIVTHSNGFARRCSLPRPLYCPICSFPHIALDHKTVYRPQSSHGTILTRIDGSQRRIQVNRNRGHSGFIDVDCTSRRTRIGSERASTQVWSKRRIRLLQSMSGFEYRLRR